MGQLQTIRPLDISFDVTRADMNVIQQIVKRAEEMCIKHGIPTAIDPLSLTMDLTACHANGTPLRLTALLRADGFDFTHDVFGIMNRIDRTTGRLTGHFSPRFAQQRRS